jgi:hypothetical protein
VGDQPDTVAARHIFWRAGIIAPWYLREDQLPLYELLLKEKNPFLECARRYGKTTTILCFVIEKLLQSPGRICLWCEPDKAQAREIVIPEVAKIFQFAPEEMRPVWNTVDSFYWLPSTGNKETASKLRLRGVNHDRGNSARGPYSDIIVADEFGQWRDPNYIVQSALRPQLQTTNGPFIFASTPPEDLGHPYYWHLNWAVAEGRFIQRTIDDNRSITPERLEELKAECGGEHTEAWQREYLCKPVASPERLVIPEFKEEIHVIPDDVARPEHFDTYVGMDLGLNDCSALLFAYVDFLKRELVIDDVWVRSGKNTKEIVEVAKEKEHSLWGTKSCNCVLMDYGVGPKRCVEHGLQVYGRWSDNEMQQLYDMQSIHGYVVNATRKDDKLAALNNVRLLFTEGRIRIKQRCAPLLLQLKVGLWNERKTDFLRGETTGHLDAIDALIYLCRNINWAHNPYPQNVGVFPHSHFLVQDEQSVKPTSESDRALLDAFTF